ncbi:MAG: ABC transporter ATP-binding protein [Thaumarchaeota archaeon]|nr:ABC transporter ATP-binding protein [Nitrososphaerota archaeon]
MELLKLENLSVHFQVRKGLFKTTPSKAVDGVSLSMNKGETLAVVGESGSGKTTLGRASLRLLKLTSGRIFFDGVDVTDLKDKELQRLRKRAQAIFQDPYSSINPFMSIREVLMEPLAIHKAAEGKEAEERVYKALADVKLTPEEEFAAKYPHMLSGGQRQRVGIARALILNPDYVVADEPVSMVDASSRAEILHLMRSLQQKYGITFLYITHDIASAKFFSDRIAVMYLGRIVELGSPNDVVKDPLHPYTQALIQAVPEPDPANRLHERKVIPGEPPTPTNIPKGCRFHPRCPSFMKSKCDVIDPSLAEVKPGHYVSCHLY